LYLNADDEMIALTTKKDHKCTKGKPEVQWSDVSQVHQRRA